MPTGPDAAARFAAVDASLPLVPALTAFPFCMPRHISTARFADGLVSAAFDAGTRADASVMPRGSTSSRSPR